MKWKGAGAGTDTHTQISVFQVRK